MISDLNCCLDTPEQLISTQMEIWDIKISDDTIFAVDEQKLASWNLNGDDDSKRETKIHLVTFTYPYCLRLSHDYSQIVYNGGIEELSIYNIQVQETL